MKKLMIILLICFGLVACNLKAGPDGNKTFTIEVGEHGQWQPSDSKKVSFRNMNGSIIFTMDNGEGTCNFKGLKVGEAKILAYEGDITYEAIITVVESTDE